MTREKLDEINKVSMEIDRLKSRLHQIGKIRRSCGKSLQIHYIHSRSGGTTGIFNLSRTDIINVLLNYEEKSIKEELAKVEKKFESL